MTFPFNERKKAIFKLCLKVAALTLAACVFVTWLVPVCVNGFLTIRHGDEFKDGYSSVGLFRKCNFMRVVNYNDETAEVYYAFDGYQSGNIFRFVRDEYGGWRLDGWEVVWTYGTDGGNRVYWPYFWQRLFTSLEE